MSVEHSPVTVRHQDYLSRHAPPEDRFLTQLRERAEAAGIPPISIGPAQGHFLQILLRLRGAREVLELGTLAGYSAIVMARALPAEGRVTTIEFESAHARFAREAIAQSDVAGRIEVLEGDGRAVVKSLPDAAFDAVFLDADKAGYGQYADEAVRLLRPGGLLVADNAFAFGQLFDEEATDPETPAIRAFNESFAAHEHFDGIIVPLGDACWVAVKR